MPFVEARCQFSGDRRNRKATTLLEDDEALADKPIQGITNRLNANAEPLRYRLNDQRYANTEFAYPDHLLQFVKDAIYGYGFRRHNRALQSLTMSTCAPKTDCSKVPS